MQDQFIRTQLLLGKTAIDKLSGCRVAVFGIGGVGGFVCEALARSGVGAFDLIDSDKVSLSNINRQIIALTSTIGQYKVDVMHERMLDINPDVKVRTYKTFVLPENADDFPFEEYDYIVDAVDTVTAKVTLVMKANEYNIPIISCMGAGNKLDGTQFKVSDIYKTKYCPLAKVMRHEMKKRGIKKLKVVYSEETALKPLHDASTSEAAKKEAEQMSDAEEKHVEKRDVPGSTAFVPSVAGLIIGGEVIKDLTRAEFAAARGLT